MLSIRLTCSCQNAIDGPSLQKSRTQDLSLSLGASLQPALEVDDKLLRQADEIFEKEQEFVVGESATSDQADGKPELFINKLGFVILVIVVRMSSR